MRTDDDTAFHQTSPWNISTDATVGTTTNLQAISSIEEGTDECRAPANLVAGYPWPDARRLDDVDWVDADLESFSDAIAGNDDPLSSFGYL